LNHIILKTRHSKFLTNLQKIFLNLDAIIFEDNPQARQKQSEITTKYFEDNPEARQQISESLKKYYKEVPDAKQKNSEAQKKYYKDNPEARQQHSEIKKNIMKTIQAQDENYQTEKEKTNHLMYLEQMEHI